MSPPAEKTLERLFGWTHGACKDICPTVVFRCTPPGGGTAIELEPVQLLPPSRDDRDVEQKKREGGKRGRVDGYPVPVRDKAPARSCWFVSTACRPKGSSRCRAPAGTARVQRHAAPPTSSCIPVAL